MPPGPDNPAKQRAAVVRRPDSIEALQALITEAMEQHGYPKAGRFGVRLAVQEALANALTHGHRSLPDDTPVNVEYAVTPSEVRISVQDQGPGFDPGEVPDPTLDENLEVPSGRGLMLMRAYMTTVAYNATGNRIDMMYRRPA